MCRLILSALSLSVCFFLPVAGAAPLVTGSTGGSQSHNNVQPSLAVNHIIALNGVYPSRNMETALRGSEPYIGEVTMFAGTFAPRGWALADGQLLPINQYDALFSILGTTYGGDGRTTFALPDLRGRTAVQPGQGAGLTNRRLGEKFGAESSPLNTAQMPAHTHTVSGSSTLSPTLPTGGGQSHDNMQPSLGLNHTITLSGIFPSRNMNDIALRGNYSYLGGINMFAGNFAPRGEAMLEGQLLPISQNQSLYSLLGTSYGGDGRTTFALPDLRGRSAIQPRTGPGLSRHDLGEKGGVERVALSQAKLPSHNHTLPTPATATDNSGGGQSHTNMKPTLGLNYVIALTGTYPSRSLTGESPSELADAELMSADPFIGEMSLFAGNFAPRGWAFADGQLLQISQHTALFSLLGTTYGGDGRTTFALPDMRGRVAVHPGTGPGLSTWRLGEKRGTENETLTLAEMPNHMHLLTPDPATDFDFDGDVDLDDVNLLTAEADLPAGLAVPAADARFDLNGDNIVNSADLDQWLIDAATFNGFASPYLRGDANLDGDVDVWAFDGSGDGQLLSENLGMTSGAVWGDGDFNGDGDVDVWEFDGLGDAQLLSSNLGSTSDVVNAAVPEPSTLTLLTLGIVGLLVCRRRRREMA